MTAQSGNNSLDHGIVVAVREKIARLLSDIERERNVCIRYACESGHRASGLHSEDSDYDI